MITRIVVGLVALTLIAFVLAWCKAAGDADAASDRAAREVLDPLRERIRSARENASGTRP